MTDNENYEAESVDEEVFAATDAVNEEFVASIGDSISEVSEDEGDDVVAPTVFDGPIQTVGRRKEAVVRIR
ncbi:MAG: 30S ribosomal protein S9, partial [Corynebacterium sp.]